MLYLDANGLDLAETFRCGQCFRWRQEPSGCWTGTVAGRAVRAEHAPDGRIWLTGLAGPAPETEPDFWARYFALDLDYERPLAHVLWQCNGDAVEQWAADLV